MNFDEIYEKVKQAITLEIKYQYINFDGRRTNFSNFMIGTLNILLKKINKIEKPNILHLLNLFESYHIDSVHNRKYTIDRTLETFARLRKLIKPQKETQKEKKEFQEEIEDIDVAFVKGVGPQISKIFNNYFFKFHICSFTIHLVCIIRKLYHYSIINHMIFFAFSSYVLGDKTI